MAHRLCCLLFAVFVCCVCCVCLFAVAIAARAVLLVLYRGDGALWSSGTSTCSPPAYAVYLSRTGGVCCCRACVCVCVRVFVRVFVCYLPCTCSSAVALSVSAARTAGVVSSCAEALVSCRPCVLLLCLCLVARRHSAVGPSLVLCVFVCLCTVAASVDYGAGFHYLSVQGFHLTLLTFQLR